MSILYNIKLQSLKYKKSYVNQKDIALIYDNLSKTHYSKSSGFLEQYKKIFSYLELKKDSRILEIGCGDGFLSHLIPDSIHYVGIDISSKMIKEALRKNKENRKNISFEKVDAKDFIKFSSDNSYDLIIFSFSWKYFDTNFQNKILNILKENGSLVIIDEFADNFLKLYNEFDEFKKNNHTSLAKINMYKNSFENTEVVNRDLINIGYSQTIFLTFENQYKNQFEYLHDSGIIEELISEFGSASELYSSKFEDFLKTKNFQLNKQKYFICIAKK